MIQWWRSAQGAIRAGILLLIVLGSFPVITRGMMAGVVTTIPVDRLLKNLTRYVHENPSDARGYYELGRIHSIAFVQGRDSISVEHGLASYPPSLSLGRINFYRSARSLDMDNVRARKHLEEAVQNYKKATEVDSTEAMFFLGLGWILEAGAIEAPMFGAPPGLPPCQLSPDEKHRLEYSIGLLSMDSKRVEHFAALLGNLPCVMDALIAYTDESRIPKKLIQRLVARAWEDQAIPAYRRAIDLSFDKEYEKGGDSDGSSICMESADHVLDILRWHRTAGESTAKDEAEIARLDSLRSKYLSVSRAISPIIFPLEESSSCSDLIDSTRHVGFDLDGTGDPVSWPWIRPTAAFLVWDPLNEGRITSGRQLFGNVTWWMFWENGYRALEALDDNDDGWLNGNELTGIAIWRDIDADAVSDPGEVAPAATSVDKIAVIPDSRKTRELASQEGILMRDGRVLPTYDWVPTSIPASSTRVALELGPERVGPHKPGRDLSP